MRRRAGRLGNPRCILQTVSTALRRRRQRRRGGNRAEPRRAARGGAEPSGCVATSSQQAVCCGALPQSGRCQGNSEPRPLSPSISLSVFLSPIVVDSRSSGRAIRALSLNFIKSSIPSHLNRIWPRTLRNGHKIRRKICAISR